MSEEALIAWGWVWVAVNFLGFVFVGFEIP